MEEIKNAELNADVLAEVTGGKTNYMGPEDFFVVGAGKMTPQSEPTTDVLHVGESTSKSEKDFYVVGAGNM